MAAGEEAIARIARRRSRIVLGGLLAAPALAQQAEDRGPLVQGFSRERLERFLPAMMREIEWGSLLGAVVLVTRDGQVVHQEACGHQDMARRQRMTRESIFLLASMTSVAAMMLVEEGRISLRDAITEWLPELRDLKV